MAVRDVTTRTLCGSPQRWHARPAFSLTELLVASAIGLLVMGSVATLFSVFSRALSQGHTTVELGSKMRTAAWRLRRDLAGITVSLRPPARPEANAGYFELIEGPRRDASAPPSSTNLSADYDDLLCFTTRSAGGSFSGRFGPNNTVESDAAEVAWFCRSPSDPNAVPASLPPGTEVFNLHRRQRLIVGYVGKEPFLSSGNQVAVDPSTIEYDISLRPAIAAAIPNSLADLADRRNRMSHNPLAFPFPLIHEPKTTPTPDTLTLNKTAREGEDVVLTNVIAFDVRVFDPRARAQAGTGTSLFPGDPGYSAGTGAYGAYIDLGSGQGAGTLSGPMHQKARLTGSTTYCTWSTAYELNGTDEDGDGRIDQGTNGADDNGNGLVDEASESETVAPYPVALRGIEVRIRCYEPVSKQVRQITIRQAFN